MDVQHLPKEFKIKEGAEEFPLMVVLSVIYICNSKCPGCPYTNSDIRKTYKDAPFISPEIFKKVADECGKYDAYIRLSGGGEPLLHPQMVELIEYAKAKGAKVGLITNGSVMTPDKADRILVRDTDMIEFSVDAGDKKTYSKVRCGLDFDALVENVKYTVKKRNELKSASKIIASIVNQKALRGKLDSAVKFWEGIVDKVQVRKYLTWGINKKEESADPTPYLSSQEKIPCPWLFERLNIDSRGDVTICGEDISFKEKFANIKDASIKEIWHSDVFNHYRKMHLERKGDEISLCKNCPDWQYRSWAYNYWKIEKEAEKKRAEVVGEE
jgi:radical SAM protein with 4Fe4S-binding SPASM domain